MDDLFRSALRSQFLAALKMLENAIHACPEGLWQGRLWDEKTLQPEFAEFWYLVSHTLFWTDLYLTGQIEGFSPPAPYTLVELDPAGALPDRVYSKDELLDYLAYCEDKCRSAIDGLTAENSARICHVNWGNVTYVELLLDTMRHVQEHAAQLNMYLGQSSGTSSRWISR